MPLFILPHISYARHNVPCEWMRVLLLLQAFVSSEEYLSTALKKMSSGHKVFAFSFFAICLSLCTCSSSESTPSTSLTFVDFQTRPDRFSSRCEVARIKCAHRQGCGLALQHYITACADLIAGKTEQCHLNCQRALIGLMSSDEGQALIDCDCHKSAFCEVSKQRIEVCRPDVLEAINIDSIVSCGTAHWICLADIQCSTALGYYHANCRGMFKGSRCSSRCLNSLDILNRQEKAAKLRSCYCDGSEDFPCQRIKANTERLCFGRGPNNDSNDSNDIDVIARERSVAVSGAWSVTSSAGHLLLGAFVIALWSVR